jgi:hypothetical protein
MKQKPVPPVSSRWKPGQSGNPAGRKKGSGRAALLQKQIEFQVEAMGVNVAAGTLLRDRGKEVVAEVLRIALMPDEQVNRRVNGKMTTTFRPSEPKVRCLIAALERLVPAIKSIEFAHAEHRTVDQLTDQEICELMEKMVHMAQSGKNPGEDPEIH